MERGRMAEQTNFEIVRELGAGGMGEVYLANDKRLNRQVAIKVLPKTGAGEDAQRRMLREARMVATIDHPNVCTIYEIGERDDRPCIVMQYVQGETLSDRILRASLSLEDAVAIARQVAAALSVAHAAGIVHRDIKPGNIMITPSGLVKVLDFGLAKTYDDADESASTEMMISTPGLVAGTIPYMSPEQLRAEPLDGRSDIFSLGTVMYEMVTGHRPFERSTAAATISAIMNDDPPSLPEESSPLQRVINKALAKPLAKRFVNAEELELALEKLPKRRRKSSRIDSIAVVPLDAKITDESIAYVGEGLNDRIIARLSQIPRLRVIRYRDNAAPKPGSHAVLRGNVTASPSSLRLHLDLSAPGSSNPIWSGDFERSGREIEAVAVEVAEQISNSVRPRSATRVTSRRRKSQPLPVDPVAEKLYLRGRVQWNKRHVEGVRQAIASFQEAVETDPTYANAWAGLADAYLMLAFLQALPSREALPKAKAAAQRTIELDPTLAEPHASLGYAASFLEWDAPVARREFEEAMRINPNYSWAPHWYGLFLAPNGTLDESLHYLELARELDPLSPIVTTGLGIPYHLHRRFEEAARIFSGVLESEPRFAPAHFYLGQTLERLGRFETAIEHLETGRAIAGEIATFGGSMIHCYAVSGAREKALSMLAELEQRRKERYVSTYHFMLAHLGLGNLDKAIDAFRAAVDERAPWLYWTPRDPRLDPLRGNPQFDAIAEANGLKGETR
jgi:eukaryotic-like serine/threonine-protein kinase